MAEYSRRFKLGEYRYMTRANIDGDFVIISQNERCDHPKLDVRNVVILSIADFKNMVKVLALS